MTPLADVGASGGRLRRVFALERPATLVEFGDQVRVALRTTTSAVGDGLDAMSVGRGIRILV